MRSKHLSILAALLVAAVLPGIAGATIRTITVPDLQDPVKQALLGASDTLIVEGVATAAYCSGGGCGFYLEDFSLSPQYRGVLVFTGGGPALADSGCAVGDRVRVKGRWMNYNEETEIISLSGGSFGSPPWITKLGSPGVGAPTTVTTGDIAERSTTGEWYEGMFTRLNKAVRVTNVSYLGAYNLAQAVYSDGTAPYDTILIDTNTIPEPDITRPEVGTLISFLQGIAGQRGAPSPTQLRGYRLRVRDLNDITFAAPPNVVNIYSVANDSLRLVFDRALDPVTAQDVSKYSRATLKGIDGAYLQPHPVTGVEQIVVLSTLGDNAQTPAEVESVVVAGVKSSFGLVMPSPQGRSFLAGVIPIAQMQSPVSEARKYNSPEGSDTSQYVGKICTVRGTVTWRDGTDVWIQDPAGGFRSGFLFYSPISNMTTGDDVTVVGIPVEYFDETEFSTALFERIHGPGTMPPPIDIAAGAIDILNIGVPDGRGSAREDYEHILVRVHDVGVMYTGSCYGNWAVKEGGACFTNPACLDSVDISSLGDYAYPNPPTGTQITSIMGPVEISNPGGQCYFALRIIPRDSLDIVRGPVTSVPDGKSEFALRAAGANPVSLSRGAAEFTIVLPEAGRPVLALYDLRGRLVKTLTSGAEMQAGPNNVRWNGADAGGHRVQAGIYFAQLRLGDKVATTKLVVAN